jgi:hypothetical protein
VPRLRPAQQLLQVFRFVRVLVFLMRLQALLGYVLRLPGGTRRH